MGPGIDDRFVVEGEDPPVLDPYGFLDTAACVPIPVTQLLDVPLCLVVAKEMMGKTTVANWLHQELLGSDRRCQFLGRAEIMEPRRLQGLELGNIVLDGLDELALRDPEFPSLLAKRIDTEARRPLQDRRVLVFSREGQAATLFRNALSVEARSLLRTFHLAPLTAECARGLD
jgi:hypothetical protein